MIEAHNLNSSKAQDVLRSLIIRPLGRQDYRLCWQAMRRFTDQRTEQTLDEVWLLEHPPVFTQGQNGRAEHLLDAGSIPVVRTDRGGQITYHGPGQLVAYTLINLPRRKLNVREMVSSLEKTVVDFLADYQISATTQCKAPGVYVDEKKICSVGLRVRRNSVYHGLALNIDMDLTPFQRINPCGFVNLKMTQLAELTQERPSDLMSIGLKLINYFILNLGYTYPLIQPLMETQTDEPQRI